MKIEEVIKKDVQYLTEGSLQRSQKITIDNYKELAIITLN